MTLTLELPDDLATLLKSIPESERNHYAVAALREKLEDERTTRESEYAVSSDETYPGKYPTPLRREDCTEEEIAIIERGIADIEAGRGIDGETSMQRIFERVGLSYDTDRIAVKNGAIQG